MLNNAPMAGVFCLGLMGGAVGRGIIFNCGAPVYCRTCGGGISNAAGAAGLDVSAGPGPVGVMADVMGGVAKAPICDG